MKKTYLIYAGVAAVVIAVIYYATRGTSENNQTGDSAEGASNPTGGFAAASTGGFIGSISPTVQPASSNTSAHEDSHPVQSAATTVDFAGALADAQAHAIGGSAYTGPYRIGANGQAELKEQTHSYIGKPNVIAGVQTSSGGGNNDGVGGSVMVGTIQQPQVIAGVLNSSGGGNNDGIGGSVMTGTVTSNLQENFGQPPVANSHIRVLGRVED